MFTVDKYRCKSTILINSRLILDGEELYIQGYDPVAGRDQLVFNTKREEIGKISSDFYWELKKSSIEEIK